MPISQTSKSLVSNIPIWHIKYPKSSTSRISQSPISRILKPNYSNIPKPSNSNNQTPGIFSLWQSRGAVMRRGWDTAHWPVSTRPPTSAQVFQHKNISSVPSVNQVQKGICTCVPSEYVVTSEHCCTKNVNDETLVQRQILEKWTIPKKSLLPLHLFSDRENRKKKVFVKTKQVHNSVKANYQSQSKQPRYLQVRVANGVRIGQQT